MKYLSPSNSSIPVYFAFILFLTGISLGSYSQSITTDQKNISKLTFKETLSLGIEGLTEILVDGLETDLERVTAIHEWIISNITYFSASNIRRRYVDEFVNPLYPFIYRETNCEGYSNLFHRMAKYAGIETHVVSGYAIPEEEDSGYLLGGNFIAPNHAWNIVKIDGTWFHIDLTWDSSIFHEGEDELEFLLKPETLFQSRMPAAPMFQLCSNPIPMDHFLSDSLRSLWDLHNGYYSYNDSIAKYTSLGIIDREVMITRQYYEYNALTFGLYSLILYKKAGSIMAEVSPVPGGLFKKLQDARNCFCDALKIGQRLMKTQDPLGNDIYVENQWHKLVKRDAIKTLNWIDRQLRIYN